MNNEENNKKDGRGGARRGAGRKPTGCRHFGFKASGEMAQILSGHENTSEFIKECIALGIQHIKADDDLGLRLTVDGEGEPLPAIPVYDTELALACGVPLGIGDLGQMQASDLSQMLSPNSRPALIFRANGESMIDKGINDGDILICDVSPRMPSEHDVVVCELNGEYTCKFIRRHHGKVWLVPANPAFAEREVRRHDEFHVRGIVTSVIHTL